MAYANLYNELAIVINRAGVQRTYQQARVTRFSFPSIPNKQKVA